MTEQLLERLSNKFSEVYDQELAQQLTDIFMDLVDKIKEDDYNYFNLVKKLAKLQVKYERIEREKEAAEYDKEYFEKIVKEIENEKS